MSTLVIVESPAKVKTIKKYLGRDYEVMASMGHVRDLPQSSLGVDVTRNFRPQYIQIMSKSKLIKDLKTEAANCVAPCYTSQTPYGCRGQSYFR